MHTTIEVAPFTDAQPLSFQCLRLFHAGCGPQGELHKYRSPADSSCTIRCDCGFELTLPPHGEAEGLLMKAAIGELHGTLAVGSFVSEYKGSVAVCSQTAE